MTEITASLVKDLREQTGAGMMDCKRALQETGGDVEAARKLLREKGMAQAGKRAARATNEGVVLQRIDGSVGTMVAVGCESEPVSKNEAFKAFAADVLAARSRPTGRARSTRSRMPGSSWSARSARTSSSAAPSASRRRTER